MDQGLLTSYVFYSVLFSNILLVPMSILYKPDNEKVNLARFNGLIGKEM